VELPLRGFVAVRAVLHVYGISESVRVRWESNGTRGDLRLAGGRLRLLAVRGASDEADVGAAQCAP